MLLGVQTITNVLLFDQLTVTCILGFHASIECILSPHKSLTTVTVWCVAATSYFKCNCVVCPHVMHVKKSYASNPNISHHNISVHWWKAYIYFSMKKESDCSATEEEIKQKLESICQNDCKVQTLFWRMTIILSLHSIVSTSVQRILMSNSQMSPKVPLTPFSKRHQKRTVS